MDKNDDLYIILYSDNIPGTLYNCPVPSSVLIFLLAKLFPEVAEEEYEDRDM